jgi:RNA polymerase sigma-70 factor (ECF subfamily)
MTAPATGNAADDVFAAHRALLFTVAYEMLGSAADAEDVVQDSWLRWSQVDHDEVRDPRAYLVRVVTRQALNRLRTLRRRREEYVGPWLPEPLATTPDVAEDVELADSVSFAMLVVLETLSPLERAVFVLREVFGFEYPEIAAATERTPEAVRQLASRARKHVEARRPRVPTTAPDHAEVAARFFSAVTTGDVQALMDVLAPDVVLITDSGGVVKAARRPIHGADKVYRFLKGLIYDDPTLELEAEILDVNGALGALGLVDGRLDTALSLRTEGGRVTELYVVRNPAKLERIRTRTRLTRELPEGQRR